MGVDLVEKSVGAIATHTQWMPAHFLHFWDWLRLAVHQDSILSSSLFRRSKWSVQEVYFIPELLSSQLSCALALFVRV